MRICNHCGKELKLNGYVVDNGLEYYCCDQCLNAHYTPEEWAKMYDNCEIVLDYNDFVEVNIDNIENL